MPKKNSFCLYSDYITSQSKEPHYYYYTAAAEATTARNGQYVKCCRDVIQLVLRLIKKDNIMLVFR